MASTTPPRPPALGSLIDDGALELVSVLGYGGYGIVYRAVETTSTSAEPRSYAVKCLFHSQMRHSSRQRRLHLQEITLHQLASAHPNVVTLHRVIDDGAYIFLVMDYCPSGDLFSQILHKRRYLGHDGLIKHVFLQLLDAVEYCHSLGIYHRDLKPENVLCFNGGLRLAITDFGLATTDRVSDEFRTGSVYHMSPECQGGVFAPTGTYSPPSNDIWSLGIILLNLITGRNPWKSACPSDPTFHAYLQDPLHFLPSVLPISSEINDVLVRTLDVNHRNRISIAELRRSIKGINSFYSEDVVFENSMARCAWEIGIDITNGTNPEDGPNFSMPVPPPEEPKSAWSVDTEPEMVFAAQEELDDALSDKSWTLQDSRETWGARGDEELRSRSPSPAPSTPFQQAFDARNNRRTTPSSSYSMYSPALSEPYMSTDPAFTDASVNYSSRIVVREVDSTAYDGSVIMRSTDSGTMHTALESAGGSSYIVPSAVPPLKPTHPPTSSIDVGMSDDDQDQDQDQINRTMSWTQASYSQPSAPPSRDLSPLQTGTTSTAVGHDSSHHHRYSPMDISPGTQWRDSYSSPAALPKSQPPTSSDKPPIFFPIVTQMSSPVERSSKPFIPDDSILRRPPKPRASSFFNPIRLAFPRAGSPPPPIPFLPRRDTRRGLIHDAPIHTPIPQSAPPHSAYRSFLPPTRPQEEHKHTTGPGFGGQVQTIHHKHMQTPIQAKMNTHGHGQGNGRRRRRQPLRSARDWLFSGRLFGAGAI